MNPEQLVLQSYIKAKKAELLAKVNHFQIANNWAYGKVIYDKMLVEPFSDDPIAHEKDKERFKRHSKRIKNPIPKSLELKQAATIGSIDIEGYERLESVISTERLTLIANKVFANLFVHGIAATRVYVDELNVINLEFINGFLMPIYRQGDEGGAIIALYQVNEGSEIRKGIRKGYDVTVWDYETQTYSKWLNTDHPGNIGGSPDVFVENILLPNISMKMTDEEGLPMGKVSCALAEARAFASAQFLLERVSSSWSKRLLYLIGAWDEVKEISDSTVITAVPEEGGASAGTIDPVNLETMSKKVTDAKEDLRVALDMPQTFFYSVVPTGVGYDKMNGAVFIDIEKHRKLCEANLQHNVDAIAKIASFGLKPIAKISVNREILRGETEDIERHVEKGLIPQALGSRLLRKFYPEWRDDEFEEFVSQEGVAQNGQAD